VSGGIGSNQYRTRLVTGLARPTPGPGSLFDQAGFRPGRADRELAEQPPAMPVAAWPTPCSGLTDLFFSSQDQDIETAQQICTGCPFQVRCARGALKREEAAGVWGGQLMRDGQMVRAGRRHELAGHAVA